ncbi:hypothetical protein Anapl_04163 [Anas platyrhynchos]|uniref:Uncharacterized protein n=1 Tax=Anas platyrhynchos TaxID=8839 RepID=R0LP30_ANAPL|nr:hypothetical protein Anapl_04163 [Anas platyrhynchos]
MMNFFIAILMKKFSIGFDEIFLGEKCKLFYRCLLDAMVHLLSFHPICLTNKLELPDQVFLFLSVSASTKDMQNDNDEVNKSVMSVTYSSHEFKEDDVSIHY